MARKDGLRSGFTPPALWGRGSLRGPFPEPSGKRAFRNRQAGGRAQEIRVKRETAAEKGYGETLDYLFGLQRFGIKLGLGNITALLMLMDNPHTAYPSVHIAGSNGKGIL